MNKIDKYCIKIQKQTERLLNKLFGGNKNIRFYIRLEKELKNRIEEAVHHDVKEITAEELKSNNLNYIYAKYRTLSKVLIIYIESIKLSFTED